MLANRMMIGNREKLIDLTTPSVITSTMHSTRSNAKTQLLSNGWLVTAVLVSNIMPYFYVSKDYGETWSQLCYCNKYVNQDYSFSLASYGTNIYFVMGVSSPYFVSFLKFDALTVINTDISSTLVTLQRVKSHIASEDYPTIEVNPNNGVITLAWCVNTSSSNIRAYDLYVVKSVNGGNTWTKQDGTAGIDNLTSNGADVMCINPSIIYDSSGNPVVSAIHSGNNTNTIRYWKYDGTSWVVSKNIYSNQYHTRNLLFEIQKYGGNTGRWWLVWRCSDSIAPNVSNVFEAHSDDEGVTWTTAQKITYDTSSLYNNVCSFLITNKDGEVFIIYGSGSDTKQVKYVNNAFQASTLFLSPQTHSSVCQNIIDFEIPLTIYTAAGGVYCYGRFKI